MFTKARELGILTHDLGTTCKNKTTQDRALKKLPKSQIKPADVYNTQVHKMPNSLDKLPNSPA